MDAQSMQTLVVAAIVAGAALFMGLKIARMVAAGRKKKSGCGGDCCS